MKIVTEVSKCRNSGLLVLSREPGISHLPYASYACVQICKCAFVYILVHVLPKGICGKNIETKTLKNMH